MSFWDWFIRPFAEAAAGFVIFLLAMFLLFVIATILEVRDHLRRRKHAETLARNQDASN